ncbi:hypothetical protein R5W24_004662 [Gemmata sp. JC717]|uniref:hypothetical protein n=1 Tax=Gemmata algarum TaxID=2975278 RepID=UPI0021BB756C|nr:hypothetical protein [Gemmata algarum]MDY3555519.1 hypothetical protein [Gemmata algarum]
MSLQRVPHVPGLLFDPTYFAPVACAGLLAHALRLYERLEAAVGKGGASERARIPQPAYVRSADHNLASEEHFARVTLTEAQGRTIRAEYFPRYGEDGHSLGYFQRDANLPNFVRDELVPGVHGLVASEGLVTPEQELTWKLTANFYRRANGRVAGFPFHVDIPSNGVVTMILNVQREARFQIAKGGAVTDIALPVGALLLLSGESRYEWKHRVLPSDAPAGFPVHPVERVSLVLGYQ